jgi:hypothetical protein
MNEQFEQDELLAQLKKSAKAIRAPKLSDQILETATRTPKKSAAKARLFTRSRFNRAGFVGLVASVGVSAWAISAVLVPATTSDFHLSLGGQAGDSSSKVSGSAVSMNGMFDSMYPGPPGFWNNIDVTASTVLSDQPESGTVYRVDNRGSVKSVSETLANFFDLDVEKIETETNSDGSGVATPDYAYLTDGPKTLNVYQRGVLNFHYYNLNAWAHGPCLREATAKVPVDEQGTSTETSDPENTNRTYCAVYADVDPKFPNDKEASRQVVKLAHDLGFEVNESGIKLFHTEEMLYAVIPMMAGDQRSSFQWSVQWANSGEINSVYGYSIDIKPVAQLKTISPLQAVERIPDYRWGAVMSEHYRVFPSGHWNEKYVAREGGKASGNGKKTFLVESSSLVPGSIVDSSGQVWIVPSFALYGSGGIQCVLALPDGVIDLPKERTGEDVDVVSRFGVIVD